MNYCEGAGSVSSHSSVLRACYQLKNKMMSLPFSPGGEQRYQRSPGVGLHFLLRSR